MSSAANFSDTLRTYSFCFWSASFCWSALSSGHNQTPVFLKNSRRFSSACLRRAASSAASSSGLFLAGRAGWVLAGFAVAGGRASASAAAAAAAWWIAASFASSGGTRHLVVSSNTNSRVPSAAVTCLIAGAPSVGREPVWGSATRSLTIVPAIFPTAVASMTTPRSILPDWSSISTCWPTSPCVSGEGAGEGSAACAAAPARNASSIGSIRRDRIHNMAPSPVG